HLFVRRRVPGGRRMKDSEAVWITGVGVGTPHGWDFATVAKNLIGGQSAVRKIDAFDVSQHPSQIAAVLGAVPLPPGMDEPDFRKRTRLEQLSLWCCGEALRSAGLWDQRGSPRLGMVFGTATEWGWYWEDDMWSHGRDPICDPQYDPPALIGTIQRELGLAG